MRSKSQVHDVVFQDWTVDGLPLRKLVTARGDTVRTVPEMTRLCEAWPWPEDEQLLRSLLARYESLAATTAAPAQRRRGGRCPR